MRVLISAYACEPGRGSEPGVGWNVVNQIARYHETWVVTRASNKDTIERAAEAQAINWIFVDLPKWLSIWKRGQRGIHLYYFLWQILACIACRKHHKRCSFDLVHHVTFVNYWMPSFLWLLPATFLLGPVGGGEATPIGILPTLGVRGLTSEFFRTCARLQARINPLVRLAVRRAALAIATTPESAAELRRLGAPAVLIGGESGLSGAEFEALAALPQRAERPFRLLSAGRLLSWKGYHLSIEAFARSGPALQGSQYWIIGDGPERARLEALVRRLGVRERVRFFGSVARSRVLEALAESDVVIHPSLHDSGGWVCLEAMAAGRPVICLNVGGPATQVTEETGIKVDVTTPKQTLSDLGKAIVALQRSPDLRREMGARGRELIKKSYLWEHKGARLAALYEQLVQRRGSVGLAETDGQRQPACLSD